VALVTPAAPAGEGPGTSEGRKATQEFVRSRQAGVNEKRRRSRGACP